MSGRTGLHICQENVAGLCYRDNAIKTIVVPKACRHGNAFFFQNNNARPHRRITPLPWPAKSPDLSPIEREWDVLGRLVCRHPHKPQDISELADVFWEV